MELPVSSRFAETAQEDDPENADETAKKKLTVEEKAIFLEGDALQIEMGNIVMRTTTGNIALYDVARASQHKDRYSSLSMAVRYIAELEETRKRRLMQPKEASSACHCLLLAQSCSPPTRPIPPGKASARTAARPISSAS